MSETPISSQMHDKCKQVVMFHNIICKFFQNLKGVLPECKSLLRTAIATYKGQERKAYLEQVHTSMTPHIQRIAEFDEGIFAEDYGTPELYLLPDLDFKAIFRLLNECDMDEAMRKKTQKSIFNHLQNIYIATEAALAQVSAFNRNLAKQKDFLLGMLENLNLDEKLKARVEEMKQEEATAEAAGGMGGLAGLLGGGAGGGLSDMLNPDKLNELLGGDNFMLQLAQEVAGELDFGAADISNPTSALMNLFADNGKRFQEMIVTIGDKIQSKVASGEIDQDKLMKDAEKMRERFQGTFGNIPGISDLLNGKGIAKQFTQQYNGLSPEKQAEFAFIPAILEKNMPDWTDEDKQNFELFTKHITGPPPS